MSERAHEGQDIKKKLSIDIIGAIATDDPKVQVDEGEYVGLRASRSGELYAKIDSDVQVTAVSNAEGQDGQTAPLYTQKVGGKVTTAAPSYTNNHIGPLSLATDGDLRTTLTQAQGVPDAAVPAEAIQVGGVANATVNTLDEGDLGALSFDLNGGARVRVDRAQAAHDAAAPAERVVVAHVAETTVPTAVADGDVVNMDVNEYGRQRLAGYDNGSNGLLVVEVAPALIQKAGPLTFTQLDEPGATAATNCRNYKNFCYQILVAGSPTATTIFAEGSHDNSNWFQLTVDTTTMARGWTIANNQATCSAAGCYELRGSNLACQYIRCSIMDLSGSPESVTADIQLMLGN